MVAQKAVGKRRGHPFVKCGYGDQASPPPKGLVIFTSVCVAVLVAFYACFAWYLLTSL
jgi:hypothetical protein